MQDRAINLARDMQKRAMPPPEQSKNEYEHNKYPSANEVFGHHNPWTQKKQTPFCGDACPVKSIFSGKGAGFDNEAMLIFALMLILISDGGDKLLLLALLYIMT
ncbi:MAG: hypothetical protein PUB20_07060 [Clostridia bacterium]|nr:hypothetical protein [Clostridia bacterium]